MFEHPVWHLYDELCTARMNVYYYRARLGTAMKRNQWREVVTAASGSAGVAGLWFLDTPAGAVAWKGLTTVAAFVAVYQTAFKPSDRIRRLETHVSAWAHIDLALSDIRRRIHEAGRYDELFQKEVTAALAQKEAVVSELVEPDVDEKLRRLCFEQVKRELPPDRFFIPPQ